MMERRCESCSFFKLRGGKVGDCRRNPPTPFMVGMPTGPQILGTKQTRMQFQFPAAWPVVQTNHWCGEYHAKSQEGLGSIKEL